MTAERTIVQSEQVGDQVVTVVHHVDQDGNDLAIETGTHPVLRLATEDFGTETALPERARPGHR